MKKIKYLMYIDIILYLTERREYDVRYKIIFEKSDKQYTK
jgi:hypothetical protein